MLRFSCTLLLVSLLLLNCGTPVDPESIDGDDAGYKIVSRYKTVGYAQDVVIEDGLNVGDVVVIKGQMQIKKEGDPVTIVTSPKP